MPLSVVILAAGQGTRMRSQLPKVLHAVGGQPMLAHTIDSAKALGAENIIVVYGHGGGKVQQAIDDDQLNWVEQKEQLGTGHAVQQAIPKLSQESDEIVLVLYGDVPLVRTETLQALLIAQKKQPLAILTTLLQDPSGYGRIVRGANNTVEKIVEEKDADTATKQIQEINTGILCASSQNLIAWLDKIDNHNQQQEYYLTDCVESAVKDGNSVAAEICQDASEVMGVNTRVQLAELEAIYQARKRTDLMLQGVTLRNPESVHIEGNLDVGNDIVIEPNVLLRGNIKLADDVTIGMNCVVINTQIAQGAIIHPNSHIEDATIGTNCEIGPFARVRPNTKLGSKVKLGNFVEVKKSNIADGSKVNHLSYIGDASIGKATNVGAGTICCNYDGANKHQTTIGNDVFIGSDTQLVAPVNVADGATIGAGSTITRDVPADKLTLSRCKQTTVESWQRPTKKGK